MKYVYLLESDGFYKIGVASEPHGRIRELQTGNPHKINLIANCKTENAHGTEWFIHSILSKFNVQGEWFRLTSTEIEIVMEVFNAIETEDNSILKDSRPKWIEILDRIRR